MPTFSAKSLARLAEADPRLQTVFLAAIKDSPVDFRITCGHRNKEDQEAAVARGARVGCLLAAMLRPPPA